MGVALDDNAPFVIDRVVHKDCRRGKAYWKVRAVSYHAPRMTIPEKVTEMLLLALVTGKKSQFDQT